MGTAKLRRTPSQKDFGSDEPEATCKQAVFPWNGRRSAHGESGVSPTGCRGTRRLSQRKKTCKCTLFTKRLKGFEPSTFCMASRTLAPGRVPNSSANERFSHPATARPMPCIHRETTGVSGPKPDRASKASSAAGVLEVLGCGGKALRPTRYPSRGEPELRTERGGLIIRRPEVRILPGPYGEGHSE